MRSKCPSMTVSLLKETCMSMNQKDLKWDPTMALHKNERYFYCIRENDSREVSGRGWWKATSHVKKIYSTETSVVGYKRPLTYHKFTGNKRKRNKAIKTNWIMYEYSLESYTTEWRLCKIKYKGKQSVQEELENIKRGYRLSNDISEEEEEEKQQQPQSLEQIDAIYEPEFTQNMELYSSYDPILTHITKDYNFGDYNQLEQLPYSLDELFPSFW
ncbi:hypothetical protein Patl1_26338 [Pistacia atlantica]|uniref:Uncharacterized protein n=1 Tax=Pistacia atlantica TaxID=434234 RepID=A0ACC1B508_9ROSI|nr:hypothetical protein Patl1_26338 [Pistacia atlantica]